MEELLRSEQDTRRLDNKRKGDGQDRAKKGRKFDRMVWWGEVREDLLTLQEGSSHREEEREVSSQQEYMSGWKIGNTECRNKGQTKERLVAETERMLEDDRKTLVGKSLEKKKGK